jgi:hypothetical protein
MKHLLPLLTIAAAAIIASCGHDPIIDGTEPSPDTADTASATNPAALPDTLGIRFVQPPTFPVPIVTVADTTFEAN